MDNLLAIQYNEVKSARQALFNYCKTIAKPDLFKNVPTYNNHSIIYMLVHSANTYLKWLLMFDKSGNPPFFDAQTITDLEEVEKIYAQINTIAEEFLEKYNDYNYPIMQTVPIKDITVTLTPLQLFTHVITHEFHHKGQILNMSRQLGYIPADTDIIRT